MIICEIGLNHLGKEDYASEYIEEIIKSRADALTFQVREKLYYQRPERSDLILGKEYYTAASKKIKNSNKKFGMAISDEKAIDFFETLNTDFYKVLSQDIVNFPLIDKLLKTNKPIFISTGMSDLEEISRLFQHIEYAKERVTFIHTQLSYDIGDVNLAVIPFLHEKFNLPIAFGSHCTNHNVLFLSLAFHPSDIFFYLKGNRTSNHRDEEHAIPLKNVREVIDGLVDLPRSIGGATKLKMDNLIKKKNL